MRAPQNIVLGFRCFCRTRFCPTCLEACRLGATPLLSIPLNSQGQAAKLNFGAFSSPSPSQTSSPFLPDIRSSTHTDSTEEYPFLQQVVCARLLKSQNSVRPRQGGVYPISSARSDVNIHRHWEKQSKSVLSWQSPQRQFRSTL